MISIITPCYFDEKKKLYWLDEMIESVKSQSFKEWEIILMDDQSPIPVPQFADSNIRTFRLVKNVGPGLARNTAVRLAQFDCILPVDADDILAEGALQSMWDEWSEDKTKVIYGDLQRMSENGEKGKAYNLPDYDFTKSLDFGGIMPVTCMHSKEAHNKAGGWKAELTDGIEDIEYWISCGKAGFCGKRINKIVLLYRKHDTSRTTNVKKSGIESALRNAIIKLHEDVYIRKEYPMGCCGGRSYTPPKVSNMPLPTALQGFADSELIWVQYVGKREASFGVVGKSTGTSYTIQGRNHRFQVHRSDASLFQRIARGKDFNVGVQAPEEYQPKEEKKLPEYQPPPPKVSTIERLDRQALQEQNIKPEPQQLSTQTSESHMDLSVLDLSENVQLVLEREAWSIEDLANAREGELRPYPGIGPVTEKEIIEKSKAFLADL